MLAAEDEKIEVACFIGFAAGVGTEKLNGLHAIFFGDGPHARGDLVGAEDFIRHFARLLRLILDLYFTTGRKFRQIIYGCDPQGTQPTAITN